MKFRVERDALADAVAWTAKSLPSRPSVPVLAGVHAAGHRRPAARLRLRLRGVQPGSVEVQADADGAALVSGRLLAEITKALPAKPVDIAAVGAHLELVCGSARFTLPTMPVEDYPTLPAMPASAGTVDAADVRRRGRPGRHRRRPRRDAADDDRRPDRAERHHPGDARHRPLPAGHARDGVAPGRPRRSACNALVPARTLDDTAKTLGPLGGEVDHRAGPGRRRRGHDRLRRRHPPHHQPAARRRQLPAGALAVPGQPQRRRPGCRSPRWSRSSSGSRWSPSAPRRCCSASARTGWWSRPAAPRRPGPARRWRPPSPASR